MSSTGSSAPALRGGASTRLIDAVVRQTMVLIANLATASGQRATLARVANQVFGDLVGELKQQGLGNKVIADMFGLALRTYHKKIARLSESQSFRGQSIWEAVLALVERSGPSLRADVLARFGADDEAVVRGVLSDLVDNGLLFRTGAGDRTSYRAARADELPALPDKGEVLAQLVLVALHQHGPVTAAELAERVAMDEAELAPILSALVDDGRAARSEHAGVSRYRCERVLIGYRDASGWQAAVYDHYQAMVGAISHKLQLSLAQAEPGEQIGGSTYTFDLWRGHPFEREALGLLAKLRAEAVALRTRVDAWNRDHAPDPGAARFRVVSYVGQNTIGHREENGDDD